jgi:hypothetical protein
MTPHRRPVASLIAVPLLTLALGACGATAAVGPANRTRALAATASPSPSVSPSRPPSRPPAQGPVARAWARWQQHRPADYRYRLALGCFCVRWTYDIEVRNGKVTHVRVLDDHGRPVRGSGLEDQARTVDDLFAELLRAEGDPLPDGVTPHGTTFEGPAAHLQATFDEKFGYPLTSYIDWSQQMADEESGYAVSNFEVL